MQYLDKVKHENRTPITIDIFHCVLISLSVRWCFFQLEWPRPTAYSVKDSALPNLGIGSEKLRYNQILILYQMEQHQLSLRYDKTHCIIFHTQKLEECNSEGVSFAFREVQV